MKIGQRIKNVLFCKGHTAMWLAEQLKCERTNVYDIFRRSDISVNLLTSISIILEHDFFAELSSETFGKEKKQKVSADKKKEEEKK